MSLGVGKRTAAFDGVGLLSDEMKISMARFRELVAEALDDLPEEFRQQMENVDVVVENLPSLELQRRFSGLLLGLYQGIPLTRRSVMASHMPDLISLYKDNIEKVCSSEAEIREQVYRTVVHEVGHHFGLSEQQLEDI